jgi:hypothetical protein
MDTVDNECKPMQIVQMTQGAVNCYVAWPMVHQGDQDKMVILPIAKREVATPSQGKNTKVVGLPCVWSIHAKHKLDRKA